MKREGRGVTIQALTYIDVPATERCNCLPLSSLHREGKNEQGAAIILPDVDQEGGYSILERIYHSINLLQSETVIPPLKRETDILIGLGSYPKTGLSLESLLYHTGLIARRLRFRPAVTPLAWSIKTSGTTEGIMHGRVHEDDEQMLLSQARSSGIPFMQLPVEL